MEITFYLDNRWTIRVALFFPHVSDSCSITDNKSEFGRENYEGAELNLGRMGDKACMQIQAISLHLRTQFMEHIDVRLSL